MKPSASTAFGALHFLAGLFTRGVVATVYHGLTLLGLGVALLVIVLLARSDLRLQGEQQLYGWLLERQMANGAGIVPDLAAVDRATATHPHELPEQQAAVAFWLSRKYRVAPEPMAALVAEAYEQGDRHRLDPLLILAVIAIESRFNPFAQSGSGAQGLMQVMTRVHTDKYETLGGTLAAFDPVSNMRVGVSILKNYIRRTGSVEKGLKYYVGAANLKTDGGYAAKVLAEHKRIREVADNFAPASSATAAGKAPAAVGRQGSGPTNGPAAPRRGGPASAPRVAEEMPPASTLALAPSST